MNKFDISKQAADVEAAKEDILTRRRLIELGWKPPVDKKSYFDKDNDKDNPAYSDIISDGGMDPRHEYEQERAKKTDKPVDRFDLEEQIMDCWSIIDDLKLISDSEENKAIITLYQLKFTRLWETFETLIKDGNI